MIVAAFSWTAGIGILLGVVTLAAFIGFAYVGLKRGAQAGWRDSAESMQKTLEAITVRCNFLEGQVTRLTAENAELRARPNIELLTGAVERLAESTERVATIVSDTEADVDAHRRESDARHRKADDRHLLLVRELSTLLDQQREKLVGSFQDRDEAIIDALVQLRQGRPPDARTRTTDQA